LEAMDRQSTDRIQPDEEEMNRRLLAAARFMRFSANFSLNTTRKVLEVAGGMNGFQTVDASTAADIGGNKASFFFFMVYQIEADEALVLEFDLPPARYWGLSLGNVWFGGLDYSYHQSSLNAHQAVLDRDGKFRAVIAMTDPGVPNWIDPVDTPLGIVLMRVYHGQGTPAGTAKKVPLARAREHMPPDTATVTPEQRHAILERRKRASLRRYGF
ncbi:MAG: hypothetical protein ABW034_16455, partial [Steroidobacteraceae bacterium]